MTEATSQNLRVPDDELARWWRDFEIWKADRDARRPLIEGQMKFAELSVRSLLILSGGAALAIIGFAANTATRSGEAGKYMTACAPAIGLFGVSAVGAVFVAGLAYLSQTFMVENEDGGWLYRSGEIIRVAAIVIWFGSLGAFGWALWIALDRLASLGT